MMKISAILTAAGQSKRMGRLKPLLPWPDGSGSNVTLVQYQVSQLKAAGISEIIIVLGHRASEVIPLLQDTNALYVVNPDYMTGKTTSIKAGLTRVDSAAKTIVLLAVDQPRPASIIREVVAAHKKSGASVTSPRYKGRGGHPIVFDIRLVPELNQITEEGKGIREVISRHESKVTRVEISDPRVRFDLNTPEDYEDSYETYNSLTGG